MPLGLLPLTAALTSALGVDEADDPVLGFYELRRPVVDLAAEASLTAPVAYVHAEFHGGTGFQAAVGWLDGAVAFGPRFTANRPEEADEHYEVLWGRRASGAMEVMAIDEALQFLGIEAVGDRDEFDIGSVRTASRRIGRPPGQALVPRSVEAQVSRAICSRA